MAFRRRLALFRNARLWLGAGLGLERPRDRRGTVGGRITSAIEADLLERGVDEERARLLAHISGGRPGYARKLINDITLLEKREERLDDLQTLLPAPRVAKFSYAEKLAKDKNVMRQTILIWLSYWRDVMLRVAQAETPLINIDRNMEIEFLASRLNLHTARRVVSDLESTLEKMDRNVNSRLLAEVLLLDWPKV